MKSHKADSHYVLGPRTPLAKPCLAVHGAHAPTTTHNQEPKTITHNDEKIGSGKWFCNMEYVLLKFNKMYALYGSPTEVFIIITLTTCQ